MRPARIRANIQLMRRGPLSYTRHPVPNALRAGRFGCFGQFSAFFLPARPCYLIMCSTSYFTL
jgi:hypothetical protein